MIRTVTMILAAWLVWPCIGWPQVRFWTYGQPPVRVEAELVDFDNGIVWLRAEGRKLHLPLSDFSPADQEHVRGLWATRRVMSKRDADADREAIVYGPPRLLAHLANPDLAECSGMCVSRRDPSLFWAHNDSGDDALVYLFDRRGRDLGRCRIEGLQNFDWEDMASFTWRGKPYLLVADTGNEGLHSAVQMLHWLEEPPADAERGVALEAIRPLATIHYAYEDDYRDCEALAVDPQDRTILLVSKSRGLGGQVYRIGWPDPIDPRKAYVARPIARLHLPPVTGMDISADGRRAILGTYESAYEFSRRGQEDWAAAFSRPPRELPMPRREQGEGICYGADGRTLYLTSERRPMPLWEVPALETPKNHQSPSRPQ